jgi:hypothetical protein
MAHAPEQGHNHNLDSIALNYPCPISRLRVISHNRTKCRENGTREQNYFLSIMSMQVYNTPLGSWMGTGPPPPLRGPGCPPSMFFTLMVGVPGSPTPGPPRGSAIVAFYVDGGCSRISINTSQGGPPLTFLNIDGERSRISSSYTSQGGPLSTFLSVDGGHSWISSSGTSQGPRH